MSDSKKRPSVDEHSFDLAEYFLWNVVGATEDDKWALAKELQDACESACREAEERRAAVGRRNIDA